MASVGVTRTLGTSGIPVWQGIGKDISLYQGGFTVTVTGIANDTVIPAGTPVVVNEANRTATFLPTGTLNTTAGGSDTAYKVNKGHTFKVGDYFASGAVGGKAYAITSIDTSNAAYDTINVGTTIGAVTAGDLLYASTATGSTSSALPASNGLLYEDLLVKANYVNTISAVWRGIPYARRVPYSAAIAALTGLKDIKYSQSK